MFNCHLSGNIFLSIVDIKFMKVTDNYLQFSFSLLIIFTLHLFLLNYKENEDLTYHKIKIGALRTHDLNVQGIKKIKLPSLKTFNFKSKKQRPKSLKNFALNQQNQLNFSNPSVISLNSKDSVNIKNKVRFTDKGVNSDTLSKRKMEASLEKQNQRDKNSTLEQNNSPSALEMLNDFFERTNFDTEFIVPENISAREQNNLKGKLESFYLRVKKKFFASTKTEIIRHFNFNPNQPLPVDSREDLVTFEVTYDYFGNMSRILTIKTGKKALHRKVFSEAVRNIKSIPNPPKILLDKNQNFKIRYSLKINFKPPQLPASFSTSGNL